MNKNKILCLAVHPDDETLGCGGTLLMHKAKGDEIYWCVVTSISQKEGFKKEFIEKRAKEIKQVSSMYNFDDIYQLNLKTMKVDEYSMSELITKLSNVIKKVKPNILFLPFKNDVHSDHRKIFEAAYSFSKPFRYPFIKKIYMMETLSETEYAPLTEDSFIPNVFVDITKFFEKKLKIMQVFESELGKHPFPRSLENIKALATLRGTMAGCKYAESFVLLKEVL
ncbi:MAG: PIG-L family deacetylase [bacterium]|nr:PIG-L family deacetylase [bacterium]